MKADPLCPRFFRAGARSRRGCAGARYCGRSQLLSRRLCRFCRLEDCAGFFALRAVFAVAAFVKNKAEGREGKKEEGREAAFGGTLCPSESCRYRLALTCFLKGPFVYVLRGGYFATLFAPLVLIGACSTVSTFHGVVSRKGGRWDGSPSAFPLR